MSGGGMVCLAVVGVWSWGLIVKKGAFGDFAERAVGIVITFTSPMEQ